MGRPHGVRTGAAGPIFYFILIHSGRKRVPFPMTPPAAVGGSLHELLGAPGFACVPNVDTLQATKVAAAQAASATDSADRIAVERMSGQCSAELKTHPAVAGAVGKLKVAMATITQPGASAAGTCLVALYLSIFVALAPVADNLGLPLVCVLSTIASDPSSDILDPTVMNGFQTADAGKLDLKLYKLLSIIFQSIPAFAAFASDCHHHVGQSGMNMMMGFLLYLYRMEPLHLRFDLMLHLCAGVGTPGHNVKWGGANIRAFVADLKLKHRVNSMLVKLMGEVCKNFLEISESSVCAQLFSQKRTPIDTPLMKVSIINAIGDACTFNALPLLLESSLASQVFPKSATTPEVNEDDHDPDVNRVDKEKDSPGKRRKKDNGGGPDTVKPECPCCHESECAGKFTLSGCKESRQAGRSPLHSIGSYPRWVQDAITRLQRKPTSPRRPMGTAHGVCWRFNTPDGCHFGDGCKFKHEKTGKAAPAPAALATNNIEGDNEFERFKRFQEYERQQRAASTVTYDTEDAEGMMGRYIAFATHRRLFRLCTRDIRLSAKLPCGRQGNPMLAFLLARRFTTATAATPERAHPARALIVNGIGLSTKHLFDTEMTVLTSLINNRLFASQLLRSSNRGGTESDPRLPPGRGVSQSDPRLSGRGLNQKQTRTRKKNKHPHSRRGLVPASKHKIHSRRLLGAADAGTKHHTGDLNHQLYHDQIGNRRRKTACITDADIIRYTRTPLPMKSAITQKVLEESGKELTYRTRGLHRLPHLTCKRFVEVHHFLDIEERKLPATGANSEPAKVSAASEKRTRKWEYASGSRDDTSIVYPVDWTVTETRAGKHRNLLADIEITGLNRKYRQLLAPMDTYDANGVPAVVPPPGCFQPAWFDKDGNHTHGCVDGLDPYGLPCVSNQPEPNVNGLTGDAARAAKRPRLTPERVDNATTFVTQCDSGTNVHTSNRFENFISYRSYAQPRAVSVASGQQVFAVGEGRVCIALKAEKLQHYKFHYQRGKDERIDSDQTMHIMLERCLHVPSFKQNFLDETQVRKVDKNIHIVGDSLSKRIVDTRRGLQYTLSETGGQEYVRGHTLTKKQYNDAVRAAPEVHSFEAAPQNPNKREKKQMRRSMGKLTTTELKKIVHSPALDARYTPFARESARIELCRSGTYTYEHGQNDLLLKYHHKFGHASMATTVRTMKSMGVIEKLDKGARLFCMHCLLARPRRIAARKAGTSDHKNRIFSKFFVDCAGPFAPAAGTMNRYAMTVIDRCSGQNYTYYCKSQSEVPELFKKFLTDVKLDLAKAGVREIDVALGKMIVQTDNASVFAGANSKFSKLLESLNIKKVHGLAYTAQHQAKVERFFGTIKERSRSLLRGAGLEDMYWEMAWRYCTSVYNYLDNASTLHRYSPYQMVTGKSPVNFLNALKPFGARCVVTVPTSTKSTTYEAVYLGHSIATEAPDSVSGHWVLDKSRTGTVIKRVHNLRVMDEVPRAMADNTIVNLQSKFEDDLDQLDELWSAIDLDEIINDVADNAGPAPTGQPPESGDYVMQEQILDEIPEDADNDTDHPETPPIQTGMGEIVDTDHADAAPETMGPAEPPADFLLDDDITPVENKNWVHVPDLFDPGQHFELATTPAVHALIEVEYPTMGAEVVAAHVSDKIHYTRAAAMADHPGYADSDRTELAAMEKHKVWDTVPITSLTSNERQNLCRAHMLRYPKFSGETNGERQVEKLKSRLVFDGRSQSTAQSGNWTASNTPRQSSIMLHFGMAPLCENEVFMSTDISTAFLRAPQHTADGSRCVMRMPRDIATFTRVNGKPVENVHILRKSLYGQRQSSLAYERLFVSWACDDPSGPQLKRSTVDPCVFYSKSGLLRMIVFVDDCNWRGCPKESAELVKLFETRWQAECKPCKYFLNMRLGRDDNGYINISQPHYADHMAKVFQLQSEKLARTPLPPGTSVSKLERANFKEKVHHKLDKSKVKPVQQKTKKHRLPKQTVEETSQRSNMDVTSEFSESVETDALIGKNLTRFKEAWGQLSYYATATRPDLCYAVSLLGQVSAAPRMRHWRLAQQVIRYAYHTRTYGIQFRKPDPSKVNRMECYVDSSFGEGPLARSQTGYVFMFNGGPISWASRLQSHTSTSTMEAETSAACDAAKENAFLRDLCYEMGSQQNDVPMHANSSKVHPELWVKPPIQYHEDNAACLAFNQQINVTRRNRHMGRPFNLAAEPDDLICADRCHRVNFHSLRDHIADAEATMTKCDTEDMLADILTKALNTEKTVRFRDGMLTHIPVILDWETPPQVTSGDLNAKFAK